MGVAVDVVEAAAGAGPVRATASIHSVTCEVPIPSSRTARVEFPVTREK
jgi:hypothetical protein